MSWHELELNIPTLEAETVNNVYENIEYLKNALEELEYSVGSITAPNASYDTQIYQIKDKLQTVENDIAVINLVIESIYFDEAKSIGTYFKLVDYQRWVNILNDIYDILFNGKGAWCMMTLTGETGNPDAQDVYGNDIYIRGDTIG